MATVDTTTAAATTAANTAASAAEKARTTLGGDFETFLTLLTVQLKNQDPIEPMDTNEFTSQLVQFATVEQAIQQNENLETLIDIQEGTGVNTAAQYMGRFVQAEGNSGYLSGGVAAFSYDLPSKATSATVTISDDSGKVVFNGNAPTDVGLNDVIWDGSNTVTGADMPDGVYHIAITAKDASGNPIKATTYTTGFVNGVSLSGDIPKLKIGKIEFEASKVLAIRDPEDFAVADS